jgi:hypothetical protein
MLNYDTHLSLFLALIPRKSNPYLEMINLSFFVKMEGKTVGG